MTSLTVAPPALRHAPTFLRATCPATTTQCPPSRNATLVVGGDAVQGGPTMTGSGRSATDCQLASARLMYSSAFSRHTFRQYWLCVRYSLPSTIAHASGSTVSLCAAASFDVPIAQ